MVYAQYHWSWAGVCLCQKWIYFKKLSRDTGRRESFASHKQRPQEMGFCCVCRYMFMCVYVEARRQPLLSFVSEHPPIFETMSLTGLELTKLARLDGQLWAHKFTPQCLGFMWVLRSRLQSSCLCDKYFINWTGTLTPGPCLLSVLTSVCYGHS